MGHTIPPPREPPIQGLPNWFTRSWWRFFSQIETSSDEAIVIANNALTIANTAISDAATAQAIAIAAQATANNAEDLGVEAILRPDPVIPDLNQAVLLSLMLG